MKNEKKSIGMTIGGAIRAFCQFLTILFCALRACDVITWKWYWVISPYLICELIGIVALIVAGVLAIVVVADKDK